jgi:hypothetical protein
VEDLAVAVRVEGGERGEKTCLTAVDCLPEPREPGGAFVGSGCGEVAILERGSGREQVTDLFWIDLRCVHGPSLPVWGVAFGVRPLIGTGPEDLSGRAERSRWFELVF